MALQVVYERISWADALALLQQHLTANLVKLRRQWHRQYRGIPQAGPPPTAGPLALPPEDWLCMQRAPEKGLGLSTVEHHCLSPVPPLCSALQGSTLSTLLCSIYLAHVERTHLRPLMAAAAEGRAAVTATASLAGTSSRGMLTALAAAAAEDSCPAGLSSGRTLTFSPPAGGRSQPRPAAQPPQPAATVVAAAGAGSQEAGAPALLRQAAVPAVPQHRATLLMRLVDDFLLVTSLPRVAAAVAERMLQGKSRVPLESLSATSLLQGQCGDVYAAVMFVHAQEGVFGAQLLLLTLLSLW